MKDVRSTVMQLSGRWGNTCYNMLCLAVEAAKGLPREEFQMKRIWSAVREATGKSPETISRALTRAATDIWERGNRAEGKWSLACDMAGTGNCSWQFLPGR